MKDNTPIYPYSATYAREHDELPEYRASYKANTACRDAIDAAISQHYRNNSLSSQAVKDVVAQFGFDRTLYVLANTARHKDWDGRFSMSNKQWARDFPVTTDINSMGDDQTVGFIANSHPGLLELFIRDARHEFLLTQPLTVTDIRDEAARILGKLQTPREPNSPDGTHFMAEVSPDFLLRAGSRDTERLAAALPFRSFAIPTVDDRKGIFAMISSSENRNQQLKPLRGSKSVLGELENMKATAPAAGHPTPKKQRGAER